MYQLSFNILQLDFARVHIVVDNLKKPLKLPSLIHLGQIWSALGPLKDHLEGPHGIFFPCMEIFFHIWKKKFHGLKKILPSSLELTLHQIGMFLKCSQPSIREL